MQRRRDRLRAALPAALEDEARHLLDEQRHAAGALADPVDDLARQGVALGERADHLMDLPAVEGAKRDGAVMRARAPGRAKFRPRRRHDEERRQRAALGEAAHQVERGRAGPMQVFKGEHDRLRARARREPGEDRGHLPAAQFFGRERRSARERQRNVDQRRKQRNVFRRVKLQQRECRFEIGEAPLRS